MFFGSVLNLSSLNGKNGFSINAINASDRSGRAVSVAGDINGDDLDELIIGAYLADANGNNSGQSYVIFGSSNGFANSLNLSSLNGSNGFVINGIKASDQSGFSVSSAGDINGDDLDELIIGARFADANGSASGQSYVIFGSSNGFANSLNLSSLNGSNGFVINGIKASDQSGYSVSSAGDINGDGNDELIIGALGASPNGSNSGQNYVIFGSSNGFTNSLNLSSLNGSNGFVINGINAGDLSGVSVSSAGDINGDGNDELIIGALGASPNGSFSGQSYVVFGSSNGFANSLNLSSLNGSNGFVINGINAGDLSGVSVSSAGDINGDGLDEVIIGALGAGTNGSGTGQSYVVFGSSNGFANRFNLSSLNGSNGFIINGIKPGDQSGVSVSSAGDINGDGLDEVIIGAYLAGTNGSGAGQSYVIFGSTNGFANRFNLSSLNGSNGFIINGINAGDQSGFSVSSAGDVNGDGLDEVIIGALGADTNGSNSGQSYVIFGRSDDSPPVINLSADNYMVDEGSLDYVPVTITRTGNMSDIVSVTLTLTEGTARNADDYTSNPLIVNLASEETSQIVDLPLEIVNDGLIEADETINITLSNPTGDASLGSPSTAILTIIDNDSAAGLHIRGTNNSDTLLGDEANDTIDGVDGDDTLLAAEGEDILVGGLGNDILDGENGDDTLNGGSGDDTYIVDSSADVVSETSTIATEIDTVQSGITYTLLDNLENLFLLGASNLDGVGNSLNNSILGNTGDNTLDGQSGNDILTGGLGNDIYIINTTTDVINETSTIATEIDTVQSDVTYTISANLENLFLLGASNLDGVGNSLNNSILGNTGDNTLDGQSGNDILTGGLGNDIYIINTTTDVINETSTIATEIDTVQSDVTYTISANLENLFLLGASNLDGVGNSLNNNILGNSGDNTLDGQSGNDILTGGLGNDIYIVDSLLDVVNETSTIATEIDTVQSDVTYTLSANLENLFLIGVSNLNGVGNSLNNNILGNSGNNTLDGQAGNDTLTGGLGSDIYLVNSSADVINEISTIATEIDNVQSSATYTLTSNLENLTLTGSSNLSAAGNHLDNTITANNGNNVIRGGKGKDTLIGNVGNDYLAGGDLDDSLVGGQGNDSVYGGFDNDSISAGDGNDLLSGDAGKDSIEGGDGNDYLDGGAWYDTMVGGVGNDTYFVDSSLDVINETSTTTTEIDEVRNSANFSLSANLENLILQGNANIFGQGNSQQNTITGNIGNNFLTGGDAVDKLIGNDGNDRIKGDAGSDSLTGGNGKDTLIGFGGASERDILVGGADNDVFFLGDATTTFYDGDDKTGYGIITDLAVGDKIQLKSSSSNYDLAKNINFLGTKAKDTAIITSDGDVIGIVQDNTSLITSVSSNIFIYV